MNYKMMLCVCVCVCVCVHVPANVLQEEKEVLKQIEREVRMREGASKLLAACSQREQALEASKSLLTSNAHILALLSQLQRLRKAQILQRVGRRSDGVQGRIVQYVRLHG